MPFSKNKLLIVTVAVHLISTVTLMIFGLLSLMGGTLGGGPEDLFFSRLSQALIWVLNPLAALPWTCYLEGVIEMNTAVGVVLFVSVILGSLLIPKFIFKVLSRNS